MGLILGIDPGFATMGMSLVKLDKDSEFVLGVKTLKTEPSPKKAKVRASDDNFRRGSELTMALYDRLQKYDISAVCMEAQSWPRNASSSAKVGMGWGIVCALTTTLDLPVLHASPQAIKKAVVGKKSAAKQEIIEAIKERHPEIKWPDATGVHEHIADSIGAVIACFDSDVVKMVRRVD